MSALAAMATGAIEPFKGLPPLQPTHSLVVCRTRDEPAIAGPIFCLHRVDPRDIDRGRRTELYGQTLGLPGEESG